MQSLFLWKLCGKIINVYEKLLIGSFCNNMNPDTMNAKVYYLILFLIIILFLISC